MSSVLVERLISCQIHSWLEGQKENRGS